MKKQKKELTLIITSKSSLVVSEEITERKKIEVLDLDDLIKQCDSINKGLKIKGRELVRPIQVEGITN